MCIPGSDEINLLTKRGLRGDLEAAYVVIDFLWKFENVAIAKYVAYAFVYQIAMNVLVDTSNLCAQCGGVCCREGPPIPIYSFDIEDLRNALGRKVFDYIEKMDEIYVLRRPCPFQRGWKCAVHAYKPYACLSYPFMVEEIAIEGAEKYDGKGLPDIVTPPKCLAGVHVKNLVDGVAKKMVKELGREPTPRELLNELLARFGRRRV